jgi:predicted peptidase
MFEKEMVKKVNLEYLLYLPANYDENKKWPLIMFLHGAGERGSNIELVKIHGIPKIVENDDAFPFIAISPQCPEKAFWGMYNDVLFELLKEIENTYSVDKSRVYLTGLSMGGYGTWMLAIKNPEEFAAIVPICGGYDDPDEVRKIKDIPVWAFHGAKDEVVPMKHTQELVDILTECGGNVKFTIYPDANHDSWTETYDNPELYKWLLNQKRR